MTVLSRAEVEALRSRSPNVKLRLTEYFNPRLAETALSLFDRVAEERAAREAAEAQVARLKLALEPFAKRVLTTMLNSTEPDNRCVASAGQRLGDFRRAHAALVEET